MKKAKVSNRTDLAAMGYRLGLIHASKASGAKVELQFYDEYREHYEWSGINGKTYHEITTNKAGEIVTAESCEIPDEYNWMWNPEEPKKDEILGEHFDEYFGFDCDNYDAYDPFGNTEA